METQPFHQKEIIDLKSFGFEDRHFRFGALTFESDKYITIQDRSSDKLEDGIDCVSVIELQDNFRMTKRPIKADACLMNPEQNIIALRARQSDNKFVIQVFNLECRSKMKALDVSEPVLFWKWINSNKLGFVTDTAAYYTDIYNISEDKIKLFERVPQESSQIIGLSMDPTEKWSLLTTIGLWNGGPIIEGAMQLYSLEKAQSQRLEGHCGCFGEIYYHSADSQSTIIAFAEKKYLEKTKRVILVEIGDLPEGKQKFKGVCQLDIPSENDFPIFMHISDKHGLLYIWTKSGYYFILDISSSTVIGSGRLIDDIVFVGCKNSNTDGVYVITKRGKLINLDIDETKIANYLKSHFPHITNNSYDEEPVLKRIRSTILTDPDVALSIAEDAIRKGVNVNQIVEIFRSNNRMQDINYLLEENAKDNKSENLKAQNSFEEHQQLEEGKKCMVCLVQPVQTAFIPCGHKRTCSDCSIQILRENNVCPVCQKNVQSHLKIYD